ncbi:MAG: hypothetical protein E4H08_11105 [Candidatus Atribacteria bacterium]|nr:MAG: hypothetical protein E4H08_11105 [Candidatus Atribacteria bacterium]
MNWIARLEHVFFLNRSTKRSNLDAHPSQPMRLALVRRRPMGRHTCNRAMTLSRSCCLFACMLLASMLAGQMVQATAYAQDEDLISACEGVEGFVRLPLAAPSARQSPKKWNILLYAAADIEQGQGFNPLEPFAYSVGSSTNTNVLILEDQYSWTENDVIWLVEHQPCSVHITPVLDLGEAKTDEPQTLEQFLRFAQEWFPSERTLLFMYGHGGAWRGACSDESNGQTDWSFDAENWLTPVEMETALEAVGGVDALMFSAPCTMSSLEVAYELRDVTKLYVADEDFSGYISWWNAVGQIAELLETDPDQDIYAFGAATIDTIRETMQDALDAGYWSHLITRLPNITAIRTSSLGELATAVDAFAEGMLSLLPAMREELLDMRGHVPQFAMGEQVDVYAFAEACQRIPELSEAAGAVMQEFDRVVIGQVGREVPPYGATGGLSLYFPTPYFARLFEQSGEAYLNYDLCFLTDTRWDEMIEAILGPQTTP